jgi:5-methyltetrahydropteroyltriglutamate--homocysteine methyltransferase
MYKIEPPFRADQVGSLLRTTEVKENRLRWKKGEITAAELRAIEDKAIAETVKKVESIGMKSVTDGEFRRDYFHLDFLKELSGVSVTGGIDANPHAKVAEDGFTPPKLSVTGKLKHVKDIQVTDFNFLKSVVTQTPKVSIPSPTMVHFRGGRKSIDINSYPDMDLFFHDLSECYKAELHWVKIQFN